MQVTLQDILLGRWELSVFNGSVLRWNAFDSKEERKVEIADMQVKTNDVSTME